METDLATGDTGIPIEPSAAESQDWRRTLVRWLALSLILHLIGAVLSQGFFHSDEHFQILEFVNFKLGRIPARDLAIEFHERIRPWLGPGIFYGMTRLWQLLGVDDPFEWALSFRLLSALVGWLSVVSLALCLPQWFSEARWRRGALVALTLIWYLPAFHARVSSENWGGAALIIGLCAFLLLPARPHRSVPGCLAVGVLFGLAFEFRYQVGIMVAGAFFWFWLIRRARFRELAAVAAGILLVIGLGTAVDRWGYGQWTCAPWNYFRYNLIQNHVSDVDTDPPWDYLRRAFTESWPLLGFLLLCSFLVAWIRHPRNPLTWSHAPLLGVHALIGHKELRFLFPLIHAGPVLLVLAFYPLHPARRALFRRAGWRWAGWTLLGWDLVGLAVLTCIPAWMPIRFQACLYGLKARSPDPLILAWKDKSPYNVNGIVMSFYRPDGIILKRITSYEEMLQPGAPAYLFYDGFRTPRELSDHCVAEFRSLPGWLDSFLSTFHEERLLDHVSNWSLLRCAR